MLRNSDGCVLPSYFSGTSGLKFFVLGHWTCRSSRVNAGQPPAYGRSPGSPGACLSTKGPALLSDWRRASLCGARCESERLLVVDHEERGADRDEPVDPTMQWSRC